MEILTKEELRLRFEEIAERIKDGAVFIHPTDTIYGIGCNALNKKAVDRVRKIKEQYDQPMSIWVPALSWIEEHCALSKKAVQWLEKLPGQYTLILKLKPKHPVPENIMLGEKTVGIRYPSHWFGKIVEMLGVPIITTSANKTGQPFMTSIEKLDPDVAKWVDFAIYEGPKEARASTIVDVEKEEVRER